MSKLSRVLNALPKILGIIGILLIGCLLFISGLILITIATPILLRHNPLLAIVACYFGCTWFIVGATATFFSMEIVDGREEF